MCRGQKFHRRRNECRDQTWPSNLMHIKNHTQSIKHLSHMYQEKTVHH